MGKFFQTSIKPQTVACGTYRMYMTYLWVPQSLTFIHGSLWSRLKGGCGSAGAVIRPRHRPKETFRNYISDVLALVPGFVFPRHVCAYVFLTFSAAVSARAAACRFSWDAMMWQRWHSLCSSSSSGSPQRLSSPADSEPSGLGRDAQLLLNSSSSSSPAEWRRFLQQVEPKGRGVSPSTTCIQVCIYTFNVECVEQGMHSETQKYKSINTEHMWQKGSNRLLITHTSRNRLYFQL